MHFAPLAFFDEVGVTHRFNRYAHGLAVILSIVLARKFRLTHQWRCPGVFLHDLHPDPDVVINAGAQLIQDLKARNIIIGARQ